jgi:plasmid stability protein
MKQKRAPGGGRKPQGPSKGNPRRLSLRVRPEIRKALEVSAKKHKHSLSQEAQFHLQQSLLRDRHPRGDIVALTEAIAIAILYLRGVGAILFDDEAAAEERDPRTGAENSIGGC